MDTAIRTETDTAMDTAVRTETQPWIRRSGQTNSHGYGQTRDTAMDTDRLEIQP